MKNYRERIPDLPQGKSASTPVRALRRRLPAALVLIVLITPGCTGPTATPSSATPAPAGLANPASVFCQQQGFRLELRTDAAGGQTGICHFPDGSECEEWAYYRGECRAAGQAAAPTAPTPSTAPLTSATAVRPPVPTPTVPPAVKVTQAPEPPATPSPAPALTRAVPPTAAPAPMVTPPAAPVARARTYTSAALGVSFNYLPNQDGQTIKVLEQGDKVYVYNANAAPTNGQWLQVFQKQVDESLLAAIARLIMPGHPAQDCQVVEVARPDSAGRAPSFDYARIAVRPVPGESMEAMLPRWRTCPQPYTVVGGIGYFQADSLHPDRFLFLSIGQYIILAGPDQPWQETIKFE